MKNLPTSLRKLLDILNDGQFHSGTDLGLKLKITRSAIWKLIKQLTDFGVNIESIRQQEYRLNHPIILLDAASILDHANLAHKQFEIEIFGSIPSTQDALRLLTPSPAQSLICLAEHQTQGRGRLARRWHSPFGVNLFFSCLLPIRKELSELDGLSLVVGLAIVRALETYGFNEKLRLKWPNDIYCRDKKLGGVLIEVMGEVNASTQILIGIGLNVNMSEASDAEISQAWTSLYQVTHLFHDRNKIIGHILHWLFDYLEEFEQHGLKQFLPVWKKYDYLAGQEIDIIDGLKKRTGLACGINSQGQLLAKINEEIIAVMAGDASVRKNNRSIY